MRRLILIEGLPGTGKTTLATEMESRLRAAGETVICYREGDLHPCDLQWIARVADDQLTGLTTSLWTAWEHSPRSESFAEIEARLADLTVREDGYNLVAYTKLAFRDVEMWDAGRAFEDYEVGSGRLSLDDYRDLYLRRWSRFAYTKVNDDGAIIFDCAFFQSHIIELLGYHGQDREQILIFLRELVDTVRSLNPSITYLRAPDYHDRILRTADARGGRDLNAGGWLSDVVRWVETSPYGRANGLTGVDGALAFFAERVSIEDEALRRLDVPVEIVEANW